MGHLPLDGGKSALFHPLVAHTSWVLGADPRGITVGSEEPGPLR